MKHYSVSRSDPAPFRETILRFWKENLPGTAEGRFEWMNNGNPAGPAIWFLAFEEKNRELVGTISVLPRWFFYSGKPILAGIMGDFMVKKEDRVFGPMLSLPRAAIAAAGAMGFGILYTVPNTESSKIMEKSGLTDKVLVKHFVKPISVKYYLDKHFPHPFTSLVSKAYDCANSIVSGETYFFGNSHAQEETGLDASFELLWHNIKAKSTYPIGDHSVAYLLWRYLNNPQFKFRLLACRDANKSLQGYLFFTSHQNKIEIYDILAYKRSHVACLVKELRSIAKREKHVSIYMRITEHNKISSWLKTFLFRDAHDDVNVLFLSQKEFSYNNWTMMSGDRNV